MKTLRKKYILSIIVSILIPSIVSLLPTTYAQGFPYDVEYDGINETTDIGKLVEEQAVDPEDSILQRLINAFRLTGPAYEQQGDQKAISYITYIINILLGLVSFIALILIIYGFYLMFFSKQDEGYAKAKKILAGVGLAIVIIGLSRFIVSFFFDVFQSASSPDTVDPNVGVPVNVNQNFNGQ